jgi:trigger factor
MKSTMQRLQDGSIELIITVPWSEVEVEYEKTINHMVEHAEVDGFRKGKAPRSVVEAKMDKTKIYEEVLRDLIPMVYTKAVEEQKIKPIISPKIELKEATEKKDWIIRALTCEKPEVKVGDYQKAIKDLKASKLNKIWTPGTEPKEEDKGKAQKPTLDELLRALYETTTVNLPALLLEHEVNRLLSDLIDQTRRLGMSVEQYLSSTGRTSDTVRKEYDEQAKRTITLEFALEAVADQEGVLVSDDDVDTVIRTAKTDQEKENLAAQKYYIASVLRRQKTLDFLAAL